MRGSRLRARRDVGPTPQGAHDSILHVVPAAAGPRLTTSFGGAVHSTREPGAQVFSADSHFAGVMLVPLPGVRAALGSDRVQEFNAARGMIGISPAGWDLTTSWTAKREAAVIALRPSNLNELAALEFGLDEVELRPPAFQTVDPLALQIRDQVVRGRRSVRKGIEMRLKNAGGALLLLMASVGSAHNAAAQGAAPVGPSTLSETYDAWTVQCANTVQGEQQTRMCQMSLELIEQQSRQRVLLFAIGEPEGTTTKATLVLPFGVLFSEGVRIEMGEQEVLRGDLRTCLPAGCISEIDLGEELVGQMRSGELLTVVVTGDDGQQTRMDVSLAGFGNAYQRLLALQD